MGEEGEEKGSYLLFLPYIIQGQDAKDGLNLDLKPASEWVDLGRGCSAIHIRRTLEAQPRLGAGWGGI